MSGMGIERQKLSPEEHIATRNSKQMRNSMGFYPTSKGSAEQWDFYVCVNVEVNKWLKANKVSGKNARESYGLIFDGVQAISDELWKEGVQPELVPTRGACESLVYSTLLATMGSYDAYLTKTSARSNEQHTSTNMPAGGGGSSGSGGSGSGAFGGQGKKRAASYK